MKRTVTTRTLTILLVAAAASLAWLGCASTRAPSTQIDDAWITTKVESKLTGDTRVNNFEIDVDVTDGVVRLSGAVETPGDREVAGQIARDTEGVASVINDIRIGDATAGEVVSDAWIVTKVKSKLTADPEINPFNIDVDAAEGVVTLSGTVAKELARDEAERLAANTEGVISVENRIEVR